MEVGIWTPEKGVWLPAQGERECAGKLKAYVRQCDEVNPFGAHQLERLSERKVFFCVEVGIWTPEKGVWLLAQGERECAGKLKAYVRQCDEVSPFGAHQLRSEAPK